VLVSGAGGSIGREVCRGLLAEGARLGAVDQADEALLDFGAELKAADAPALVERCDAADLGQVTDFASRLAATYGEIDALVNVAGFWRIVDFADSTPEHWSEMLRANLLTAMTTCRAVLPEMIGRGGGAIVNFASTAGEYGSIRPSAAYAASKGGVIAFTKSLAREASPHGVRVNAVSPGPIDTPMLQAASAEARARAASRTLLGRMGTPGDIAKAVCYLASDDAAFVTGEVLRVNGGSLL
jgi:NAD(P)-dependent dehydrogenase (short-subunit alcohol dehydrogenase family)